MRERADERTARDIVSQALNVPVLRFEDGRVNAQVDALIEYPDRVAALEIVGHSLGSAPRSCWLASTSLWRAGRGPGGSWTKRVSG
jgi:hypothetical protein